MTAFGEGVVAIRTFYEDLGDRGSVPRHLWCEVSMPAPTIEDAMQHGPQVASMILQMLSLAANAAMDYLQLELVFDATPAVQEHQLWQQLYDREVGIPRVMRRPNGEHFDAILRAVDRINDPARMLRAVGQYLETLRYMRPGMEIMAIAHAWMAMEALTPIARAREVARAGSRDDLLAEWGIELKQLDSEVRRRVLCRGDAEAYAEAREASDGLEHGIWTW
ncbi:hypothetical protein ACI798_09615 [Geodermatophilus sp. SYSU D01045]